MPTFSEPRQEFAKFLEFINSLSAHECRQLKNAILDREDRIVTDELNSKTQVEEMTFSEDETRSRSPITHKDQHPPKKRNKCHNKDRIQVSTHNRFELLANPIPNTIPINEPTNDVNMSDNTQRQIINPPTPTNRPNQQNPQNINTQNDTPTTKIPPIIIHKKELWQSISKELVTLNINFNRATNVSGGMQITASTENDFRKMTSFLKSKNIEYHTFSLPSEKQLRVVIRGLPQGFSNEEIHDELTASGFHPITVSRLIKGRGNKSQPMPLIFVTLPKTDKDIYNLRWLCYTSIKVESKHTTSRISQCYRCQRYGHSQTHCNAIPKCVGCAESHFSYECPNKPVTGQPPKTKPKCFLCGGAHPANFSKCPNAPKYNIQIENSANQTANTSTMTYSNITKQNPNQTQQTLPNNPQNRQTANTPREQPNPVSDGTQDLNAAVRQLNEAARLLSSLTQTLATFINGQKN